MCPLVHPRKHLCKLGLSVLVGTVLLDACGGAHPSSPAAPTSMTITSRIISTPDGGPVAGARVEYSGGIVTSSADGSFSITGTGEERLRITASGYIDRETRIASVIDMIADRPPFSLDVYRRFVRGGIEHILAGQPHSSLHHFEVSPKLYLVTTYMTDGTPVPQSTLTLAEEVFRSLLPVMTGDKFTLQEVERVAAAPSSFTNAILVKFDKRQPGGACSTGIFGSDSAGHAGMANIVEGPGCPGLVCSMQHEYLHALGFYHIGPMPNTFFGQGTVPCDVIDARQKISPTEQLIGRIFHARPIGNRDPDIDP